MADFKLQQPELERSRESPALAGRGVRASQAVVEAVFGPRIEREFDVSYWDGTIEPAGTGSGPEFSLRFARPGALRRLLLPANELTIAEAFMSGDVEIEGNIESAMGLGDSMGARLQSPGAFARLLPKLLVLPRDSAAEKNEAVQSRFSRALKLAGGNRRSSDADAIQYHYDVGNDFYALWLDQQMVYTCAYFRTNEDDLASAQIAKMDHICHKLRLEAGMRMLDIGCGWGALIMHAVQNYGVEGVGITLSKAQAELGAERIAAAGLSDRCRVEVGDYRDLDGGPQFDRITSVGVTEHVKADQQPAYFQTAHRILKPGGLFLNHCEVSIARSRSSTLASRVKDRMWRRGAFIDKYVFPDTKLVPAAHVIASAESTGFELRDVESLREHYTLTLRHWLRRLEEHREEAVGMVGIRVYRTWRLYLATAAYAFDTGRLNIIQTLLAKPHADGRSGVPLTRDYMYEQRTPIKLSKGAAA